MNDYVHDQWVYLLYLYQLKRYIHFLMNVNSVLWILINIVHLTAGNTPTEIKVKCRYIKMNYIEGMNSSASFTPAGLLNVERADVKHGDPTKSTSLY